MKSHPQKILIISPAWVGDMVMAQSLFRLIKQQNPSAIIDVLAPDWGHFLLQNMPEVNQILNLPFKHGEFNLKGRYQLAKSLRGEQYDQAIVLPNSFKSALIPFFAKIPRRTGWRGEMRWQLLNDLRYLDKTKLPLMIERFMALALPKASQIAKPYPWPLLKLNPAAVITTVTKFKLDLAKPVLVLCPGAEFGPAKRWPEMRYAEVALHFIHQGWQVWLLGSAKDQPIATAIQMATQQQCCDFTGKTNLGEAIHLLAQSQQVISNDSGLMHIAAALQRPLVVVYGSSSPQFTPPLAEKVKVVSLHLSCSPCFKRECPLQHLNCLRELKADLVLQAVAELQS